MAGASSLSTSPKLDTPAAIERAVFYDDYSGVSPEMRVRIIERLRAMIDEAIASGPPIETEVDAFFADIKKRGRERLERAKKAA